MKIVNSTFATIREQFGIRPWLLWTYLVIGGLAVLVEVALEIHRS